MPNVYEVRFSGEAGPAIKAAFPELEVRCHDGSTTLHGALSDQAALHGVIERIQSLGLELLDVRKVEDSRGTDAE